jgi:hypothetical protein
MLRCAVLLMMCASLAGCAGGLGRTYSISYLPFSAKPDAPGKQALDAAIAFAKANPLMPVTIDGYTTPPDARQFDSMAQERVRVVRMTLIDGGIDRARIGILGNGIAYAQGTRMPTLPRDTVNVGIGL